MKSDACVHGTVLVAKSILKEGFESIAVSQFQEAMVLQESVFTKSILILGRLFPSEIPAAIKAGFRITLFGYEDIRWIEEPTR